MTTKINILIQGESALDDLVDWSIDLAMGGINSVRLSLVGERFHARCKPPAPSDARFGELDIRVIIGSDAYDFLVEERSTTYGDDGLTFEVWGRSAQALLTTKYAPTVTDSDDMAHPWQSGNTTAVDAIAHVLTAYANDIVTLEWTPEDYPIYQGTLSVSNQSPIEFIRMLADEIGADLRGEIDGSLSVIPYAVTGSPVETYNDLDDLVTLSEDVEAPQGYNAVTIFGYGTGPFDEREEEMEDETEDEDALESLSGGAGSAWISLGDYESELSYPEAQSIRIYYYHPQGKKPVIWREDADMIVAGGWTDGGAGGQTSTYLLPDRPTVEFTETVSLTWGTGRLSKTPTTGDTAVTGDEDLPFSQSVETYEVYYLDAVFENMEIGETYRISVHFEDRSAEATAEWNVAGSDEPVIPGLRTVTLYFDNYHTDAMISGASVWLDGEYVGDTDASGAITIEGVEAGSHDVKATATGYTDTDLDELPNDTITVS